MPRGAHAAPYSVRPRIFSVITEMVLVLVFTSSYDVLGQQENATEALLKFKSALANADSSLSNWNPSTAPCSGNNGNWIGVLCFDGYVLGLQLENMGLSGQIDVDALTSLHFLRTLSFMNNNFQGTMPDWRKLGALKSLYLSNNQFSGEIPQDAFKGMTSLKKVYLANNKFTGKIPATLESPKIIELRLENNQFTGSIPPISSDNLKVFNVSNNQLEGPIPAPLLKMDPTSFSGNKGLCGKPVGTDCNPPIPPPDLEPSLFPPPTTPAAADGATATPTPAAPTNDQNKSSSSSSSSRIAIIILSILVGLFFIILLFLLYRRYSSQAPTDMGTGVSPAATKDDKVHAAVGVGVGVMGAAAAPPAASTYISGEMGAKKGEHQQAGKLSFVRDDRQKFDLQDLMRASAEVLGSGNFGASYKAVLVDGESLVVKRFKQMNNIAKEDFHEHMRRIGRLKHPNLLPLVAYLYRKEEKLLVFDFVSNGSLATQLHRKRPKEQAGLTWGNRLKIIKGVAKGLAYLHGELPSLTVPHGHLKSSNVLLDKSFKPLLMDYTLGPVVNPNQVNQTLVAYKSPEFVQTGRTCKKTDVWCLGILILETLTGKFVAKYLGQSNGEGGPELARWINDIVRESETNNSAQVFDRELMEIISNDDRCRLEIEKLLQIGIDCCQEDLDKRLDLEEAIKKIEQVQE